jgi:hypothetical protein
MTGGATSNRKVVASLTLLVTWELWNERNVRVFRSKHMSPLVLFEKKIKSEARLWVYAGAKRLGEIMPESNPLHLCFVRTILSKTLFLN